MISLYMQLVINNWEHVVLHFRFGLMAFQLTRSSKLSAFLICVIIIHVTIVDDSIFMEKITWMKYFDKL